MKLNRDLHQFALGIPLTLKMGVKHYRKKKEKKISTRTPSLQFSQEKD